MPSVREELYLVSRRLRASMWRSRHLPKQMTVEGIGPEWGPFGDAGQDRARHVPLCDIAADAARGSVVLYAAEAGSVFPAHFHAHRVESVTNYGSTSVWDLEGTVTRLGDGESMTVPEGVGHIVEFEGPTLLVLRYSPPFPVDDNGMLYWSAERPEAATTEASATEAPARTDATGGGAP